MSRRAFLLILIMLSALLSTVRANAAVKVEKTEYKGWKNCYRVTNGEVELIVTGDVGPRVIRFGFVGGQNLFKEYAEQLGKSGEEKFQSRGGDRVWKAPEDPIATWAPDNVAVEIQLTPTGLVAREPVEPLTLKGKSEPVPAYRLVSIGDDDTGARPGEEARSEERRVGKECTIQCRSRWSPYH